MTTKTKNIKKKETAAPLVQDTPNEPKGTKNRIKELRIRSRLTQKELGLLVGLEESSVSRHESGERPMSGDQIAKYAGIFKVQSHELFLEGEDTPWDGNA